ncbi:hypothetical protein [Vibrio sp. SCSIO 43169]|uniref:hypothetical protein n=1 Tax=Vibrio sp. SCSIO 43169 TaxID=2822801 RepID=UPI002043F33F|nr:hypothetical protein [Vibrio sp. SCSIO 43169]MCM5510622.1 hypothetical protein [Vibrio sp. SCSIO 43169]
MNSKFYFVNENYDKVTDLIVAKHDLSLLFIDKVELSIPNPLNYETFEAPSSFRKRFYDSDALYLDSEIYEIFLNQNVSGLYVIPVKIKFSDDAIFSYYRVDSKIELDLIDKESTQYDEDGDIERLVLDKDKLERLKHISFFKIKGLDANQFMISQTLKNELERYHDDIIISSEEDYEVIW